MRRLVFSVIVAFGLLMIAPSSAFADDPAPVVSAPSTPGKKLCKLTNTRLTGLSGIVATKTGYLVINDSAEDEALRKVFFLDTKCKVVNTQSYSGEGPRDTEDMILSADGAKVWIADTGDNNYDDAEKRRKQIALWSMPADGSAKPKLHRLAYPEGDYHDAEALLLNGDGTPLIVTKEVGKPAYVYEPTGPLKTDNATGVPLRRVAEIKVSGTTTAGPPVARIGNKTISGGAIKPGGGKVALRTYTDALEWDVSNGDVLGALKGGKPRTTGLPNEPLGEAITYSADGTTFLTVSDMEGITDQANYVQQYVPATTVAAATKTAAGATGKKWYSDLSIGDVTLAVGGVGVLGLILVGVGVFGIVQHRKRGKDLPAAADDEVDPSPSPSPSSSSSSSSSSEDPETELIGVGNAAPSAGVYGAGTRSGPVYGAAAGGGAGRGPVYGSGRPGGPGSGGPGGGRPQSAQQNGQRAQAGGGNGVYGGAAAGKPAGSPGQPAGRGSQGQPGGGPQGKPVAGAQGQPAGGPQGKPVTGGQPAGGVPGRPVAGGAQGRGAGQPVRGPQGKPVGGPQGQVPRGPQARPAGVPQGGAPGQPARGPQGRPVGGPQGQPPRGPQGRSVDGPQGQPPRGAQGQPGGGAQGQAPRGPLGQPARGLQGKSGAGVQGQPPRGPQGQPSGGPQAKPARGPQGGQPARAPQGQPPRGLQGQQPGASPAKPARPQVPAAGGAQGQPARGPQAQVPRGGQGAAPRAQTSGGVYGQPPSGGPPRAESLADPAAARPANLDNADYERR